LEHLHAPHGVLQKLYSLLKNDGQLLACSLNVQHYSIIKGLLRGAFQYQSTGLFESTHIKFFTRSGIQKLFLDSGYLPNIF
jgi:2-polyprenyl-3-methyl-5-hydroxy-6-metoxy-1,4-benzoquinol methylase